MQRTIEEKEPASHVLRIGVWMDIHQVHLQQVIEHAQRWRTDVNTALCLLVIAGLSRERELREGRRR